MTNDKHTYEVDLKWAEGRIGILSSPVLDDRIEVATPPEFRGGIAGIWSPEHLFISSVVSCFMTTFAAIAKNSKLSFESLDVKAEGAMEKQEGKFVISEIVLKPELMIAEEKHSEKAVRIMEKAEAACLITRSIKTRVKLQPKVTIGAAG